jgi:hypothetical protein
MYSRGSRGKNAKSFKVVVKLLKPEINVLQRRRLPLRQKVLSEQ